MANGTDRFFVNAFRTDDVADRADEPVDSLSGVSAGDAAHLRDSIGVTSVRDLAEHRFVARAAAACRRSDRPDHDPGPDREWTELFGSAPLASYQQHPNDFRLDFGPVYYRGRLDGTARVLLVGQDPAANELVAHRIFVGKSGQRVQGFLRRIGIHLDYVMVNTYLYPVFGQFSFPSLRDLSYHPDILGFRNRVLDRIAETNALEAIVTIGAAAHDAVDRWPGAADVAVVGITHPSALDTGALLANWNAGLAALRPVVEPERPGERDDTSYGTAWTDADLESLPRADLPFGVPEWMGVGSRAQRERDTNNDIVHTQINWNAP